MYKAPVKDGNTGPDWTTQSQVPSPYMPGIYPIWVLTKATIKMFIQALLNRVHMHKYPHPQSQKNMILWALPWLLTPGIYKLHKIYIPVLHVVNHWGPRISKRGSNDRIYLISGFNKFFTNRTRHMEYRRSFFISLKLHKSYLFEAWSYLP